MQPARAPQRLRGERRNQVWSWDPIYDQTAKGPVPFRPTQRDYKRQEKLVSVDSLSKIAFDDGLFRDEADLNGFVRWILRCRAKREAGTLEP